MVNVRYQDPDGSERWCANSEIAEISCTVYRRGWTGSWRRDLELHADFTGHFEVGGPARDPRILNLHTAID
jgi:hypothetical protein